MKKCLPKHCCIVEVTWDLMEQLYAGEAVLAPGVSVIEHHHHFDRDDILIMVACRHLPPTEPGRRYPNGQFVARDGVLHVEVVP